MDDNMFSLKDKVVVITGAAGLLAMTVADQPGPDPTSPVGER